MATRRSMYARQLLSPWAIRVLWSINLFALCGLAAWILRDGMFASTWSALQVALNAQFQSGLATGVQWPQPTGRLLVLTIVAVMSIASLGGIFLGLFFGPPAHRRIQSWLAFTVLLAAWLTLMTTWQELSWRGQIVRMKRQLAEFESIAASLRADWPTEDGERTELGPYMAYPIGRPQTLMLLNTPSAPATNAAISTVERSTAGALRLQLTGPEPGVWLEWHPAESAPDTFTGGLMAKHTIERFASLGKGWFLVRYSEPRVRTILGTPSDS